jgi:PKD repeat protein
VYRFDQDSLVSDLQKPLLGTASHPATGDLTGIIVRNLTSQFGTWTVIYDSEVAGTPWGLLSWNAQNPGGTLVAVRARSSEDGKTWSAWEPAADDVELAQTPAGRYLEVQVSLQKLGGDDNPRMQELTITPASTAQVPVASFTADPGAPLVGEAVSFQDTSTGSPTSWSWNFGDGETSTEQNPTHSFASAGSFDVALTAANDEGSDTDTQTIVVAEPASCSVTCSATAPQTGELSAPVAFAADATATDCIGAIAYSWSFGDGGTSATQNPSHTYGDPGTLRWGLTATADSESCTAAGDITIVGSGPDECTVTRWVPVISRTDGLDGSVWRSDIGLLGTSDETVAAELRLRTPDVAASRVITVTSGAMVALVDVIGWLDAGFDGSGSLEICADGELGIDTRTYNLLPDDHPSFPDGTQGQHLGGSSTEEGLAADETGSLGLLRESDDFRTNIGLVNTGSDPSTVEMVLFDAAGIELTRFEIELAPGEWSQLTRPFWKQAGRKDLDAASAQATVVTGAGIIVYGSVIDKRTNDATTIPMRR